MDTTKKYILMSKKAKEWLSDLYKGKPGNLYVARDGCIHMINSHFITDGTLHPDCTPLFRQDDLQEMIDWSGYSYVVSTQAAQINDFYNTLSEEPESMEQLWLAFVMKEKYQKIWNGKDWINK